MLTRDEIAMALATLGEDPTLGRVDAVRSLIDRTLLSKFDRETSVRQAADVARQKLDELQARSGVFPVGTLLCEAQVEARLRERGWRNSRMGGPADDRGNYVVKTGNGSGAYIGLFNSGKHDGAVAIYPIDETDEAIATAICETVRQADLGRSVCGRLLATVVEFVDQHPEWWADQRNESGFALIPWIVDARSADNHSKAAHSLREWVRLIDAGRLEWSAGEEWEEGVLEEAREELARLDHIRSEVAIEIGAATRPQMEAIAASSLVAFDEHSTDDELRADLISVVAERRAQSKILEAVNADLRKAEPVLPDGWTEAYPGGIATNRDPQVGGIVDSEIGSGLWFAIPNRDDIPDLQGFATRQHAFEALQDAIRTATVEVELLMPRPSSGELAAMYPARGSMPARVVEQLYAARDAEYAVLSKRESVEVGDLAKLDRGARFMVADGLFKTCSADTKAALLADENHGVRSTAKLAQYELERVAPEPESDSDADPSL
ncbi:hypothetical protein [Burkholderia cenocepacia]|uniref:hypothetical protein n=1 Tax=Burkholderia cenocepacia TaxID=95486 RepID=UPI0020111903|nr:hypothetical protein [Burkholderia cenocepacia]